MNVAFIVATALVVIGLAIEYIAAEHRISALLQVLKSERERHDEALAAAERSRLAAHEGRERLLDGFTDERREWTAERQVLLTRIQDPPAGVAAAMTLMPLPEPGHLDVDLR